MNQGNRFCRLKDHDQLPTFHICTLIEYNFPTRWCCSECISQEIHKHQKPNNSHMMRTKEFLVKLKSESDQFKENLESHKTSQLLTTLQKIVKECQGLENSIIVFRKSIESYIQNIYQQQAKFRSYQNNLVIKNFEFLDDIKLNELININLEQVNQNLQLMPLDNFKQQLYSIESIIKNFQENKNDDHNPIIDLKNRKYIIQEIDQTIYSYYGSSISKNEKYLAYGGKDKLLKIYDIKFKKIIKEIKLDNCLQVCQFTQDSSQLYVGLSGGYSIGYDVENDFKKIYKQQIRYKMNI